MELGAERAPNTTANTKDDPAALSFEVIMRLARSEVAEAEIDPIDIVLCKAELWVKLSYSPDQGAASGRGERVWRRIRVPRRARREKNFLFESPVTP
jgi:hypothetical protein